MSLPRVELKHVCFVTFLCDGSPCPSVHQWTALDREEVIGNASKLRGFWFPNPQTTIL